MQTQAMNGTECEERLQFESLLVDISSRFVSIAHDEINEAVDDALRRLCESLGLDVGAQWFWEADSPNVFVLAHLHCPPDFPEIPDRLEADSINPWSLKQVMTCRSVALWSLDEAPPEAETDKQTWLHYGLKNVFLFPLSIGDRQPFGAISFHDRNPDRKRNPEMIKRLGVAVQILAGVLVRQRYEQALSESEERLKLALDVADSGAWVWSPECEEFWMSDRLANFFGIEPGSALPLQDWLALIHEEDRARSLETFEQGLANNELVIVEYRIVDSDGGIRWMHARGRTCFVQDGTQRFLGIAGDVTEQKEAKLELEETLKEVECLRKKLKQENVYLRDRLRNESGCESILGDSPAMHRTLEMARRVAETDSTVLITGETGTGKELLAQVIHDWSTRRDRAMVKVNCAALPAPLIESELFGREKGAYTGALTRQVGRFEVANGATLFLDEIGDLPMELQAKLLRVLQDGCFERLGSHETRQTDVRVIAATNQNLGQMVQDGTFREDLYHRLNVFPIESPPLRERTEDIPELTWHFVQEFNGKMGRSVSSIPKACMDQLKAYVWPGNVRELRNLVERAMILSRDSTLGIIVPNISTVHHSPANLAEIVPDDSGLNADSPAGLSTLEEMERTHILKALETSHWRIGGNGGAAEILGMPRTTLNARIKKLGISRN